MNSFSKAAILIGERFVDIKNLLTFIQVAEMNSFSKAANVLGYSQSAVSTQIKQLEETLQCHLFERISHTITLTDKGREVLEYAHKVTKMTKQLQNSIRESKAIKGNVHIALADSLSYLMLDGRFTEFTKAYPQILLKMTPARTQDMFQMLNHNTVDFILTLDSCTYDTNYVIVKEEKIPVRFVANASHPLSSLNRITIHQLIQYPLILTEKGMSYRRIFDEKLAEEDLEVKPILFKLVNQRQLCSPQLQLWFSPSCLCEHTTEVSSESCPFINAFTASSISPLAPLITFIPLAQSIE